MNTMNPKREVVHKLTWLVALFNMLCFQQVTAQLCLSPGTTIYGITGTADIHPVDVNTGAVGLRVNPINSGTIPSLSNGMGYNPLSQRIYYFKRNINPNPQEFVEYNPVSGLVTKKANCPSASLINIGGCSADGLGYYCIDAFGILYYYRISTNIWTTISSNVRNQSGITLRSIISTAATPTTTDRVYGDLAIDGSGNMWIAISGPTTLGLYKLPAPLPTGVVAGTLTINEVLPPTNPSPGLQSIGGIAFTASGELYISTNAPDNRLYRMEKNWSLTYLSTMAMNGIGTDLASCNYPMFVLPELWKRFTANLRTPEHISLTWSIVEDAFSKQYIIEHSIDASQWERLGELEAKAKSGDIVNYAYEHTTVVKGKHYYRIVRVDMNDRTVYSETKLIYNNSNASFAIWPNPAQDVLQVETSGMLASANKMYIFDQTGSVVGKQTLKKGRNQLDIKQLKPGHYLVSIESADGEKLIHKFLKN